MFRPEYPRPQFVRSDWQNLNGKWEFCIDENSSFDEIKILTDLGRKIEVPFCPESHLSGINHKDFLKSVWYRRTFEIDKNQLSKNVIIHFGAVDFKALIYINDNLVGEHIGGFVSFSFDITKYLQIGENVVIVHALDDTKSSQVPTGKQSELKESWACYYTRTTGIWQTVWLEYLPQHYVSKLRMTPNIDTKSVRFEGIINNSDKYKLQIAISFNGDVVVTKEYNFENMTFDFCLDIPEKLYLWDILQPHLYDVKMTLVCNESEDVVNTYFGLRKVEFIGKDFYLNDRKIFLKQVLDQGMYSDGIYTAKSDVDLIKDIDVGIELGFDGARLHEKVFEERCLYHCDKKGYLVWGEYPNWGLPFKKSNPIGVQNFINEWTEEINRDYNHPSIIGWCPLNEVWRYNFQPCDYESQKMLYELTRRLDQTRPCIGASGGDIFVGDVNDVHTYCHKIDKFNKIIASGRNPHFNLIRTLRNLFGAKLMTKSQLLQLPLYVSEYGGMSFKVKDSNWGYHKEYQTEEQFLNKYEELTTAIFDANAFGMCYTQLYNVEQEQNGLLYYDRGHKLTKEGVSRIKNLHQRLNFKTEK